jgi:hypothetical protein
MNIDGGLQITDLGGILRRRAKVAAATALGVMLVVYWVAMALPNVYTSSATVLVEPQAVAEDLVKAGVAQSDINQRLHLMTAQILARPRLSKIIDDFKLYEDESTYLLREEVIDLMRSDVRVEPVVPELEQRTSRSRDLVINEFRILYDNYDAAVARDVANRSRTTSSRPTSTRACRPPRRARSSSRASSNGSPSASARSKPRSRR